MSETRLISDDEIHAAFEPGIGQRLSDDAITIGRRIEALVRKRLAERLREQQEWELRASEGTIQGSRAFGAAARIVSGEEGGGER